MTRIVASEQNLFELEVCHVKYRPEKNVYYLTSIIVFIDRLSQWEEDFQ